MKDMSDKDFIATLRDYGLQVTYQRLAIYQALYNSGEHPSADLIYQQVKKRFPMISLGTVYKTLERFFEVGLVQKVSPLTEVARYDAMITPHHHIVCLKCQSIRDIGVYPLDDTPRPSQEHGYKILGHHVVFQGLCPECQVAGEKVFQQEMMH